jgi:hypothetical protein
VRVVFQATYASLSRIKLFSLSTIKCVKCHGERKKPKNSRLREQTSTEKLDADKR